MSYNGYGMDNSFGAYAGQDQPSYLVTEYGAYGGDAVLSTAYKNTHRSDAKAFQDLLVAAGFGSYLGPKGADGFFGSKSAAATQAYQASVGLSQTGKADQATWDALRGSGAGKAKVTAKDILTGIGSGIRESGIFQPSNASVAPNFLSNIFGGSPAAPSPGTPAPVAQPNNTWKWVVGGVAVVAVLGGVTYAATRKK
tara:strand:+ start:5374 stop:5964 length:591 start_codon:yes stop_codon:yes gene_type:complete